MSNRNFMELADGNPKMSLKLCALDMQCARETLEDAEAICLMGCRADETSDNQAGYKALLHIITGASERLGGCIKEVERLAE